MLRLFALLLSLGITTSLSAQYTVGKLVFHGAAPEQQQPLEQTIRMHPGQSFSTADLQAAAQRLSDTGAFDDVQVALDGPVKSISVVFTLKPLPPSSRLLASFENFFWFTPAELQAGLAKRVPLFGPTLPESGNLVDAVQAALEDMLKERSISARVDHTISDPSPEQQARVVNFRVDEPLIVIQTVHLTGVAPQFASDERQWITRLTGTHLNDGLEHRTTDTRLLLPYLNGGYLTAHLADRKLTPITSTPEKVALDFAGTVVPGPMLHIGTVTWAGSPEISTGSFSSASPLKPGDPAALTNLEKSTELLAAPYRKEGYADVIVQNGQTIDTAAGTVSYTFTVNPGEQYRIRSIKVQGLTPAQQTAYNQSFQMKAGDLFNPDYIQQFFGKTSQLEAFRYNSGSYRAERDPAAHLADVTITVTPSSVSTSVDARP